jgi:GT2 family glycosyltransferase
MNNNYLIILLNYNNWEDTIECIQSLKESSVNDSNILVIENCSSDESYNKLITETPKVHIIKAEKNLGFTGGNNLGIKYAVENKYDYAIVLNNDTIVESKDSIRILIDEMDKHYEVSFGTGRIFYYPEKDRIWYDGGKLNSWRGLAIHFNYGKNKNDITLINDIKDVDFISGCFMCIRLKDISRIGYMDENFFIYLDDVEYSARAVKNDLKLKYFPQVTIFHKARGEDKRTPRMIYYSIRNRRLLIHSHFGLTARFYFEIVLLIKRGVWFFINKKYYNLLLYAVRDYNNKYFGQAPEYIK